MTIADENQGDQSYENEIEIEIAEELSQEQPDKVEDIINIEHKENIVDEIDLENFKPLIPDLVLDHLLETNGIDCADMETKKLIAALAQKFIADVSASAFQFHKIHQKAIVKDKRFAKEKKVTLTVADLQKALDEYGIDISRPAYFL